ncbi:hypothetical protein [Actinacidiphila rubida]|uniref:Uncharacterized protein n=1 Tax=Actinacidiphila rubida TaxID=310780 RepID=A0A1H8SVV1_9ACTN|nr:hypothetical protein [Actinacidiphila rubida]SEO82737.1 hypothetical protein SAMN05216267_10465 [Actinacidiphila rubida]
MNEKTTDPRDGLMAALSAMEQVVAQLHIAPPIVTIQQFEDEGTRYHALSLHFRHGPEGVEAFAEAFTLTTSEHVTAKGQTIVSVDAELHGHNVHAWWLGTPAEAPVSLPSEWSARGAA